MERKDYKTKEIIAYEAFIRRAAIVNAPFMLKGSYVSRQYLEDPSLRIPADLDWIYLHELKDNRIASETLSEWVTLVTETHLDDNVQFRSFSENQFWRRIDYAMADDFPTVNTDLYCWVDGEEMEFGLDVSFNLKMEELPIPLFYKPLIGEEFLIENTVPLSLQVSWKIHQTIVRPRFKDLFDLIYLVGHTDFDENILGKSFKALLYECKEDKVDFNRLKYFLSYDIFKLFPDDSIEIAWGFWRSHQIKSENYDRIYSYDKASDITDDKRIPKKLDEFLLNFRNTLEGKGWTMDLYNNIPEEDIKKYTRVITSKRKKNKSNEEVDPKLSDRISFWSKLKKWLS